MINAIVNSEILSEIKFLDAARTSLVIFDNSPSDESEASTSYENQAQRLLTRSRHELIEQLQNLNLNRIDNLLVLDSRLKRYLERFTRTIAEHEVNPELFQILELDLQSEIRVIEGIRRELMANMCEHYDGEE